VSRSPSQSNENHQAYVDAFSALTARMHEGGSLSGRERHCAFLNLDGQRFANVSSATGLDLLHDGRASAVVDWNNDGAMDLWVSNRTGPQLTFLQNTNRSSNHYLAVYLKGTTCNRDAIGARVAVHLADRRQPLLRALRGGEGFLAQSSKWLHFGLGTAEHIERVIVRWPDGHIEDFGTIGVDQAVRLEQGSAKAVAWVRPQAARLAAPAPRVSREADPVVRVAVAMRRPMPNGAYQDMEDRTRPLVSSGRPTLVVLWASWCSNCLMEMKHWAAAADSLNATGLRIVALSVDDSATRAQAGPALSSCAWPFESGWANEEILAALDGQQRRVLDRKRALGVPTSFLLDPQGRLAFIYQGAVEAEQLVEDVARCREQDHERIRDGAAALNGIWGMRAARLDLMVEATALSHSGYTGLARAMLDASRQSVPPVAAAKISSGEVNLATALIRADDHEGALAALLRAVESNASNPRARLVLARAYHRAGDLAAAREQAAVAVELRPNWASAQQLVSQLGSASSSSEDRKATAEAHFAAGIAHLNNQQFEAALSEFETVIELFPNNTAARDNAALTLARMGRIEDAIDQWRAATEFNPDFMQAHLNIGLALGRLQRMSDAVAPLRRVLELDPNHVIAHCALGRALEQGGAIDEAIEHYRTALRIRPGFPAAERALQSALRRNP
jgi:tetratricopeptide (TPR) repeat protein